MLLLFAILWNLAYLFDTFCQPRELQIRCCAFFKDLTLQMSSSVNVMEVTQLSGLANFGSWGHTVTDKTWQRAVTRQIKPWQRFPAQRGQLSLYRFANKHVWYSNIEHSSPLLFQPMFKPRVIKWNYPEQCCPPVGRNTYKQGKNNFNVESYNHIIVVMKICSSSNIWTGFCFCFFLTAKVFLLSRAKLTWKASTEQQHWTKSGNTDTLFLLFCVCWHQNNRLCHPTLCFVATQCLQNSPLPHRYYRYSHGKGLACTGGSSFRVWKHLRFCVCHICICVGPSGMWLVYNPDVMLPGFVLVSTQNPAHR